jgi:hypothetical protein
VRIDLADGQLSFEADASAPEPTDTPEPEDTAEPAAAGATDR